MRPARRLDAGAVNINGSFSNMFAPSLPHRGRKESGVGSRVGGANGLRKYFRQQAVTAPRISIVDAEPDARLLWYPYTAEKARKSRLVLRAVATRRPCPLLRRPPSGPGPTMGVNGCYR